MPALAREEYLVTEVMTAAPQKLQLMLIEAAIRRIERVRQGWRAGDVEHACEDMVRAQEIIGQILGSLNREVDNDLIKKVAAIYAFIFRGLMEAGLDRDEQKLEGVLKVLEEERETWRQVCEKLAGATPEGRTSDTATFHSPPAPIAPLPNLVVDTLPTEYSGGFSLDA